MLAPVNENLPAAQSAQTDDDVCPGGAAENLPAAQPVQLGCPVDVWYDPAGQAEHDGAPAPEYFPVAQLEQMVPAEAGCSRPAAQLVQLLDPTGEIFPGAHATGDGRPVDGQL